MAKIKIFYDPEETDEVKGEIVLEPTIAGETETKSIYIRNLIEYPMEIDLVITGDIEKQVKSTIEPEGRIVVNLEVVSKKTATRPLTAEMEINTRCLIK